MTITITDLKNQIHSAGHFVTIKQDRRGLLAGSPVSIIINRNNSAATYIYLLTMSPTIGDSNNTEQHFITHITIDDAITFRVPKTMSTPELWRRIYEFRLKTMPPPEPHWRQRNRHHRHRQFTEPKQPTRQRYLQRPSKHQPRRLTTNASPI
jgi:hypothetical protein